MYQLLVAVVRHAPTKAPEHPLDAWLSAMSTPDRYRPKNTDVRMTTTVVA